MHSDYAPSDMAVIQELSKPYPGQRTRHFGADALLLSIHRHPASAFVASCVEAEISFHGQDNCHANLRPHSFYLGFGCR